MEDKLRYGFTDDDETAGEGFQKFSLAVQNRRKAREGYALQNHLEEVFRINNLLFQSAVETENLSKPDFLFPNSKAYHNLMFPNNLLTMLGVKTTCKDG